MKRLVFVLLPCLLTSNRVFACTVCLGDPNSPMTHGAKAAVWFLLGVVIVVLSSIAGVALYWTRRARLLRVQAALRGESLYL